jgi:hypothetical protein
VAEPHHRETCGIVKLRHQRQAEGDARPDPHPPKD